MLDELALADFKVLLDIRSELRRIADILEKDEKPVRGCYHES